MSASLYAHLESPSQLVMLGSTPQTTHTDEITALLAHCDKEGLT